MADWYLKHPWAFTFGILGKAKPWGFSVAYIVSWLQSCPPSTHKSGDCCIGSGLCLQTLDCTGNISLLMVFLSPLPTFYRVYKKKLAEGFQPTPYVVTLFSSMLWMYYAVVKTDAYLLITINTIGCAIEAIYIVMYLIYAPNHAKFFTVQLILCFNFGMFGLVVLATHLLLNGQPQVIALGWICAAVSMSIFAVPLNIIRLVIQTKSVEFMPFMLSLFLTLNAIVWFLYGILSKDFFVALPNILGFAFGIAQIVLYIVYKNKKPAVPEVTMDAIPAQDHYKELTDGGGEAVAAASQINNSIVKDRIETSGGGEPNSCEIEEV